MATLNKNGRHRLSSNSSSAKAKNIRSRNKSQNAKGIYSKLKFSSVDTLQRSLSKIKLQDDNVRAILDSASVDSLKNLRAVTRSIIIKKKTTDETRRVVRGLVEWASVAGVDEKIRKQIVIESFRKEKGSLFLIHGISTLPRENAKTFMQSYFDNGGSMKDVAEWFQHAGKALKLKEGATTPRGVAGKKLISRSARWSIGGLISSAGNAFSEFVNDTLDSITDAVTNMANAVISGAKSLGQAISAAASWTVDQIGDFVRALIRAGRTTAAILTEAFARGLLTKFVKGVLDAGRALGEVMTWAMSKAASVIESVLQAVLSFGRSVLSILQWVASQELALIRKVLAGLLAIGKTIAQIMVDVLRFAADALKRFVGQLIALGTKVADILVAVATSALSIIRTVLEGLLMIGVYLKDVVVAICQNVASGFRRGFFEGLRAMGYAALDLLKAAATAGAAVLGLAFAVILELAGGHRELTAAEKTQARKIFGWSIDLDRVKVAVASIPADIVNYVNNERPFTTMYVINFSSSAHIDMSTLIHELTHVWQAVVAGPVYMVEALHSQYFGRGYDVTDADIAAANGNINNLQREQQAVVVERYWRGLYGGFADDWRKYELLAKQVYRGRITLAGTPILRPISLAGLNRKALKQKALMLDVSMT